MNEKTMEQRVQDIEKTLEGINSDEFNTAIANCAVKAVRGELDAGIAKIISHTSDLVEVMYEEVVMDKADKIVVHGFAILGKKALYLPIVGAKAIAKLAIGTWKAIPKVVKKSAPVTPEAEQQAQAATPAPVQA